MSPQVSRAHFFVVEGDRVGAAPAHDGGGWFAEIFLNIPEQHIDQLITVEAYVAGLTPDFTFRTTWIDFPAGPADTTDPQFDLDSSFATMGDFLNDYIFNVSDPSKLNEPLGNFFIRFSGLLKVSLEHDIPFNEPENPALPVDVYFATWGFDGYRTRLGATTIYRVSNTAAVGGWGGFIENGLVLNVGLYPIEISYFNRYDPTNVNGNAQAGIELYSWHGGGPAWQTGAGQLYVHPIAGPMTLVPTALIYEAADAGPIIKGDFDADFDFDLFDYQWFQWCYTGDGGSAFEGGGVPLGFGCTTFDFLNDADVDALDYASFQALLNGPGG